MSMHWRLLRTPPSRGAWNMALDEALLEAVAAGRSAPLLRLYRWQPATVTLGYAQRGADVVNLAACRELGLDVVRRCTGGRAVLHEHEATYAVIAPERGGPFPGGILANYGVIAGVLGDALRAIGLTVSEQAARSPAKSTDAVEQSACFTAPASFEQVCHGCKVTGSAQKRFDGAFLQHGSIPVDLDPARLFRALDTRGTQPAAEGGRRLAASVGWVNRWLEPAVTIEAVEEALLGAFAARLGLTLVEDQPSGEELARCAELLANRYDLPCWNLQGLEPPGGSPAKEWKR